MWACLLLVSASLVLRSRGDCAVPPTATSGVYLGSTLGGVYGYTGSRDGVTITRDLLSSFVILTLPSGGPDGTLVLDTCSGTAWDSLLAITTRLTRGCPANGTALVLLAADDDARGCGNGLQSRLAITAQAGATYGVLVAGFSGSGGAFSLTWTFASATPSPSATHSYGIASPSARPTAGALQCWSNTTEGSMSTSYRGTTTDAFLRLGGICQGVSFDAAGGENLVLVSVPASAAPGGYLRISTCGGASFDTLLLLSKAGSAAGGCLRNAEEMTCVASNDDDPDCVPQSTIHLRAEPSDEFVVLVSGYRPELTGPYTLTWGYEPPPSPWPILYAVAAVCNLAVLALVVRAQRAMAVSAGA